MNVQILDKYDEEYLVKACRDDSAHMGKIIYDRYAGDMMILCLRYLGNKEDARDTVMEAFYNFLKNINSFTYQGQGSVKAWLKKITVNQCLMHLRKQKRLVIADKEVEQVEVPGFANETIAQLSAKEIMKLVQTLPDGYRTVFNLYVFEEKSHKEIGALLGISENTSKSQLHKAKELLKKKILQ